MTRPRLVSAILARNEAAPERYLRRVLARCAEFSTDILVLDDGSTDDTAEVARTAGCFVVTRTATPAWGAEAPARRDLWERAAALAGDGWVLVCDADMELVGDPRPLTQSWDVGAWAWPLCDLWNEREFRVDGAWGFGPRTPRPWLFRPSALPPAITALWPTRGIHCGHAPANFLDHVACGVAPSSTYWLHWAYATPAQRAAKHAAYATESAQLTPFEQQHAASILDADA